MAKTYRKRGNKLEITRDIVEETTIAELEARHVSELKEVEAAQARADDTAFQIAKARELGVTK